MTTSARQQVLSASRDAVLAELLARVDAREDLVILRAPPGSGKTYAILFALALCAMRGRRVAVSTFTNAQADDLCSRLASQFPEVLVVRWTSVGYEPAIAATSVQVARKGPDIPLSACVVVATSSKWATSDTPTFDALFVDEAWQLPWAEFTLLGKLAETFVLVGDPGQIAPVVSIDTKRWETAAKAPHRPAPVVILNDRAAADRMLSLPVTTRLPYDSTQLVQQFYDFSFDSWADEGSRRIEFSSLQKSRLPVDAVLAKLGRQTVSAITLPTTEDVSLEYDQGAAESCAAIVRRAIEVSATVHTETGSTALTPTDIGIIATHRVMVSRIIQALGPLAAHVRVDTAERWQGLERSLMVALHPLSGVRDPSQFDLVTGRLCVMTSRHRAGLVLVTRDHVGNTLANCAVPADHPLGCEDSTGLGHARHEAVWNWLQSNDCFVAST